MIKSLEEEQCSLTMMTDMMVFGKTIFHMVMVVWSIRMVTSMKVNGIWENAMVMEFLQKETVTTLKDVGLMTNVKGKEATSTLQKIRSLLVNGLTINLRQVFIQKWKIPISKRKKSKLKYRLLIFTKSSRFHWWVWTSTNTWD